LKCYCNHRGIEIIGDIPFYAAYESADVWAHPEIFRLNKAKKPLYLAGVPPDYFSRSGQLWGNPVYDWKTLKDKGYSWWKSRIEYNLRLFDIVRIDHFRGFFAFWQVPTPAKTAIGGRWVAGPKADFLEKCLKDISARAIIVEDLGHITSDVREFIEKFHLRGMRVLMFGFERDNATNPHYLHNHIKNSVVYTGTHDNNTVRGWFEKEARPSQKRTLSDCLGHRVSADKVHWELIRMAMSSVGNVVIVPMQDVLGLGAEARMNRPATVRGNWCWRLCPSQITSSITRRLAKLTRTCVRA